MTKRGRVLPWNVWNFDAEPGDIMVTWDGRAFRLYSYPGPIAAVGELSTRELKRAGKKAQILEGRLVWVDSLAAAEEGETNPRRTPEQGEALVGRIREVQSPAKEGEG